MYTTDPVFYRDREDSHHSIVRTSLYIVMQNGRVCRDDQQYRQYWTYRRNEVSRRGALFNQGMAMVWLEMVEAAILYVRSIQKTEGEG
jgi:hypothetical protein